MEVPVWVWADRRWDRDRADLFDVAGGGSFKAVGIGGGLSGRGFTHGVIDDYCKDREEANAFDNLLRARDRSSWGSRVGLVRDKARG